MSYLPSLELQRKPNPRPWLPALIAFIISSVIFPIFLFIAITLIGFIGFTAAEFDGGGEAVAVAPTDSSSDVRSEWKSSTPEERLEEALRTNEKHEIPPLGKK